VAELPEIDAKIVCQLAALNGFDLSLERAEMLVPALQEILKIDAQVAQLLPDPLTVIDLPQRRGEIYDDSQS